VLDDFSSRPEAIPLALSRIKPCGDYHAATIDAVSSAINMLKRRQNDYRRAILLISEMRDYGSRSKLPDVVAEGEYISFTTQRGFENGLWRISNHIHDYYLLSFKPSSSATLSLHTQSVRAADNTPGTMGATCAHRAFERSRVLATACA